MFDMNKQIEHSRTINNIVFILYSIGLWTGNVMMDYIGLFLTLCSFSINVFCLVKGKEYDERSSHIHSLIFCICSFIYALFYIIDI